MALEQAGSGGTIADALRHTVLVEEIAISAIRLGLIKRQVGLIHQSFF